MREIIEQYFEFTKHLIEVIDVLRSYKEAERKEGKRKRTHV